jgi:cytochrome c-type protein NapB
MIKQSIITIATLGLLTITASAFDTKGCTGCHGVDFEKAAMGKSKVVKDMSKADIETALKGYKDGTYGGPMKAIMKGQAAKMSAEDITAFASSFGGDTNATDTNATAPATDANTTTAPAKDANTTTTPAKEVDVTACAGCHGKNLEKVALGKSKKVNEMTKAEIVTALKGYKDGTYGGPMKGMMKGQAAKLSEDDINAIAEKFGK